MTPELQAAVDSAVEAFGTFLLDDDRTSFTFDEAREIAEGLGLSLPTPVVRALKDYGFTMAERQPERRVRGFTSSSNDRWFGPGSERTHGGSGWEQINGFAGDEG
jgi:hypothetical protein